MKEKISKKELKRKAESIKGLVDDIINERVDVPDKALVVDFDATLNIFTPKRMELINIINVSAPNSVQELADLSKRTKQAVDRDLKMLERFEVVKLERNGKCTIPVVKREMIVLTFKKPKMHKEEVANLYLDNKPAKEVIGVPV